ncbi:MAG: GNAT family N-acetyltransferase [Ruminococcaceae bacterium]|nr:GNAT family N-acetyltransferase [Oscillospiraceae bacterium]
MQIRFAKNEDIPAMIRLLRQVGRVHYDGRPDIFRADAQKYHEKALLALLQDDQRPILVAETAEGVVGYAFCVIQNVQNDPVLQDRLTVYIDDLCVDENCRGSGVGKALYAAVLDYARGIGAYNVTLNVWAKNENALKFYEKMGLMPQKYGMETVL